MKFQEAKYAVAYARFSSDNQRTESIDAQIRAIKEYCVRENYVLLQIYVDEAQSATSDKRDQFQQMIADSRNNDFQYIIVHKLDRFSRDRYDSAVYKRQLRNNGVRVVSVLERLDDSPESVILEALLEAMSEYYSVNLAREVRKGMKENALKCIHTGGTPALGYEVNPQSKMYTVNALEADTVRIIFELYVNDYGYAKIANILNSKGRKTKRGKPFSKNSIREILTNEKYKGVYVFNKSSSKINGKRNRHVYKNDEEITRIPGGIPEIVSVEIWNRANSKLGKLTRPRKNANREYLFTGRIQCGKCGSSFIGRSYKYKDNERYNYACNSKLRRTGCDAETILADHLENIVFDLIHSQFLTDAAIDNIAEKMQEIIASTSIEAKSLLIETKKKLDHCENKSRRLLDLYYNQAIDIAEFKNESQVISGEMKMLQDIIDNSIHQEVVYSNAADIKKFLVEIRNTGNKKILVDSFVDKIIVQSDEVIIYLKDASDFGVKVQSAVLAPFLVY